jgi:hypothetical protein
MIFIFGGVLVTSYFIYKYRSNVTYNLLRAFSYVEDYIPNKKHSININRDGVYSLNMDNYTIEFQNISNIPEDIEQSSIDLVYISKGKIFNSVINSKNLEPEIQTIKQTDIAAASISFDNDESDDQEIDITDLIGNLCINEHGLNLTIDSLPIILILYNEFYDGNYLIEEFINKNPIYTIITTDGKIISLSSINLNITI